MKKLFTILLCTTVSVVFSQYQVGKMSKTYQDPDRSNRNVTCDVHYPSTSTGNNTPWATGQFPIIIFGHGFVMGVDAYNYFKEGMVPLGYIVVLATTEGSMSPSHADFGADLAFLLNKIKSEAATNSSSEFYNKLTSKSAIMGHSMGGGASFLACQNNTVPTCMVTYAAAKSTPSSITAAFNVTIPALVMSGEIDCVAPPADHQTPMYDSLASSCKYFISIKDGGHCYFGDYNFNCTFGESTCQPTLPISRAQQQATTLDFTKLYLAYYLKNDVASLTKFNDSLQNSPRITYRKSCPTSDINENNNQLATNVFYSFDTENLVIQNLDANKYDFEAAIYNTMGQRMYLSGTDKLSENETKYINVNNLKQGYYILKLRINNNAVVKTFVK